MEICEFLEGCAELFSVQLFNACRSFLENGTLKCEHLLYFKTYGAIMYRYLYIPWWRILPDIV